MAPTDWFTLSDPIYTKQRDQSLPTWIASGAEWSQNYRVASGRDGCIDVLEYMAQCPPANLPYWELLKWAFLDKSSDSLGYCWCVHSVIEATCVAILLMIANGNLNAFADQICSIFIIWISMTRCKKDKIPLLTHCNYVFLALSYQYIEGFCNNSVTPLHWLSCFEPWIYDLFC